MSEEKIILKHALQNAVNYNGKANTGAVIGKILSEKPELKNNISTLSKEIQKIVNEVNSLTLEQQKERLKEFASELPVKEKKKEERKIPDLENVKGKVVMRFAPNPNGPISLGHCRPALWNWFFVEKYKGTFILRFDDTDAKIKVPLKEAYKWFEEDLGWLGIKPDKIVRQSDRLDIYYEYAEKLIEKNGAYICTCNSEKWKELTKKKIACPCRSLPVKEQLKRWENMFTKYKEGQAVYRIKTDISHENPAMRDWPAFRIIDKPKHPLKKAKVWPLLNFASAIDDNEFKVTHILRGIDLHICDDRQKALYKYFNWIYPETIYNGKLLVKGIKSTSQTSELIKQGKLSGWDDPRLGTIKALRRRGFQPEAIINFIKDVGINRSDIDVSIDNLASINKSIIDKKANRYFFIENPKKIKIKNAPKLTVKIPLHPDYPKRGNRILKISDEFYIQDNLEKDKNYRFMHLFNFKNNNFISKELDPSLNAKLIHWLPVSKDLIKVEIITPENEIKKGLAEPLVKNKKYIKIGDIIQFIRFGFCRLDKRDNKKLIFYFAHG